MMYWIKKFFERPWKGITFMAKRLKYLPLSIYTQISTYHLVEQKELLDAMRQNDEYLLIILDACRYDIFEEEYDKYLSGELHELKTKSRDTFEYAKRMWSEPYDVTYISGAPPINTTSEQTILHGGHDPNDYISTIIDAWDDAWDEDVGGILPETITDIACSHIDNRMVVHYFQPHAPYIGERSKTSHPTIGTEENSPDDRDIWQAFDGGEISEQELEQYYRDNLRRVLESVRTLIKATDIDRVVVTADHGEALGEFGIGAHPRAVRHPKVARIPWLCVDTDEL